MGHCNVNCNFNCNFNMQLRVDPLGGPEDRGPRGLFSV